MRGPFHYGVGAGFVTTATGHRLSKREAVSALARETGISKDLTADPRAVALASQRVTQLTEAMRLSFTDNQEALL